jgi:hypothetical protein
MVDGARLFSLNNEDVEKFRQVAVLAFDKFIISMVKLANFNIIDTSDYYKKVEAVNI